MNLSLKYLVVSKKRLTFASVLKTASRGGAVVARWAHNPKAGGSIPSPATKREQSLVLSLSFLSRKLNSIILIVTIA